MQIVAKKIVPCLWFDTEAEEAARFYVSIFANSHIRKISRYGEAGQEVHGRPPGSVMTVEFEIAGQTFTALNGGPCFKFNEAISFQIMCETQDVIDHFWARLSEGGEEGPCGWLKDRYDVSWQVVPAVLPEMMTGGDPERTNRIISAVMKMRKFEVAALERAYAGRA